MSCLLPPICVFCRHLLNEPEQECRAFREIPDDIMTGKCDHTDPYQGDNGLRFQLVPSFQEDFDEINLVRQEMGFPAFRLKLESEPYFSNTAIDSTCEV